MGSDAARLEPLALQQQLQYERMMYQWISLYRHLIMQRQMVLPPTSAERLKLESLSSLVDKIQESVRESDREKTERLNNQLLEAIRSYDYSNTRSGGQQKRARKFNRQP